MLIPMDHLVREYNILAGSVLHVGAHHGEEAADYAKYDFHPVYWVEGDDNTMGSLAAHVGKYRENYIINAVVADEVKELTFNVANNGQSSSILEFGTHSVEHPDVVFTGTKTVTTTTIDNLYDQGLIGPTNFLNLDIQGAELLALRGAANYLDQVRYIYTEVNEKELYKGCVLLPELETFLGHMGYVRRELEMTVHGWGDGFYVRRGKR